MVAYTLLMPNRQIAQIHIVVNVSLKITWPITIIRQYRCNQSSILHCVNESVNKISSVRFHRLKIKYIKLICSNI